MRVIRLLIILFAFISASNVMSQDNTGVPQISSQYFEAISKKTGSLEKGLDKKSRKVLERMQREEERLKNKLAKIDSLAAIDIFKDVEHKYAQLQAKLKGNGSLSRYIPNLDTLTTSLKFLEQNPQWLTNLKDAKSKLTETSSRLKELKSKLQGADDIKQFLNERREYLKQQLEKFGLAKELKKIGKEAFYFSQQVNEYREILKDSKKAERKAIELLSKTKLFQDFMRKNSMLASLFRMPGDPNDPTYQASLTGLQTRSQVNSLIQNQVGGQAGQQAFQQNVQQAQSQMQQLKDKISKWGSGSSEDIMPDGFKPNDQKTKSFFQRLEVGSNIQTQGTRYTFPITSDLGLSVGYKLNDKSIVGVGASYKMGWGTGWNNLRISHQGLGLRSFIDYKLKGSFWLSGGYEQNHKSEIRNIDQLRDQSAWQQSGLIGLGKIVSVKSKVFKKTKMQLLWDFLSYNQIPKAQPIIFRLGYSFN